MRSFRPIADYVMETIQDTLHTVAIEHKQEVVYERI